MVSSRAVTLELDAKGERLLRRIETEWTKQEATERLLPFFNRQALIAAGFISRKFVRKRLRTRTGHASQSIIGKGVVVNNLPAIRVGWLRTSPAINYIGVQEFGTFGENPESPFPTIKPKRAKSLAMPLEPKAVHPSGVAKYSSPRDYPEPLSFIPRRTGNVVGFLVEEDDLENATGFEQIQAVYMLLRQVDIKPQWFLRDGFDAYLPQLVKAFGKEMEKFLGGR